MEHSCVMLDGLTRRIILVFHRHAAGDWQIDEDDACFFLRHCKVCSEVMDAALNHDLREAVVAGPQDGQVTSVERCARCDYTRERRQCRRGHSYDDGSCSWCGDRILGYGIYKSPCYNCGGGGQVSYDTLCHVCSGQGEI